jgi:hypothetical protein
MLSNELIKMKKYLPGVGIELGSSGLLVLNDNHYTTGDELVDSLLASVCMREGLCAPLNY